VLLKLPMDHLKFAYTIKIVEKTDNNYLSNSNLITRTEFSPYFENSLLQVSLKNVNIIDETVFRRQITYGIGLFLFLGVMVLGLYLLIQDVNREKRMNKLRADFVSNVTHELKTPLTAINMFAEAMSMRQDNLDSKQKKYTTIIVKESEKLKRMINNILEFSKKENNKMSYKLERSNLTDIVSSTLKEMNYFLEINNIDVHLNISNDMYANVYAEGIKQALSNLISNAIKYSSSNKKLNIQLYEKGKEIFIEVEDFGIGIPKEKLELIFEKFYRVNSNENETASGTGLGLTVTKDIIEEQHGKLLVESTLGKGSKFTIVLHPA
jgi:two-component system phosphate regulon sensor histidine kinase PhoR